MLAALRVSLELADGSWHCRARGGNRNKHPCIIVRLCLKHGTSIGSEGHEAKTEGAGMGA
jgi:hypothetical protein